MGQRTVIGYRGGDGIAVGLGQATVVGGGGPEGDLLADDHPDGELVGVDGARESLARSVVHHGGQGRIFAEVGGDGLGVGVEVQ